MEKKKIIVTVEGGLVTDILSNTNEEIEVLVVDYDSEGADQDEILKKEEINDFKKNNNFKPISYKSGVAEDSIF